MCYGDLDPKFAMRDIDARLEHVSAQPVASVREVETTTEPAPGLGGWAIALFARFRQKEARHG